MFIRLILSRYLANNWTIEIPGLPRNDRYPYDLPNVFGRNRWKRFNKKSTTTLCNKYKSFVPQEPKYYKSFSCVPYKTVSPLLHGNFV